MIIASDKKRPSRLPAKLSAIFGAELFSAGYDMEVRKKQEVARKHGISNLHERDALGAAVAAYNFHRNKLEQAGAFAKEHKVEDPDMLKAMVIKRYSMHEAAREKITAEKFKRY